MEYVMTNAMIKYAVLISTQAMSDEDDYDEATKNGYTYEPEGLELKFFDSYVDAETYINNYHGYRWYTKQYAIVVVDMSEDAFYSYEECLYFYGAYGESEEPSKVDVDRMFGSWIMDALDERKEWRA